MPIPPLPELDAGKPPQIAGDGPSIIIAEYGEGEELEFDWVDSEIVEAVKAVVLPQDLESSAFISVSLPENSAQDGRLVWFLPEIDDEVLIDSIDAQGVEINDFAADAASVNAALAEYAVIFI